MKPRPYQSAAIAGARQAFRDGARSCVISMPTGTGKSLVFRSMADSAARKGGRSLMVVHGRELVEQGARHMQASGHSVSIEMDGHRPTKDAAITVASIDTISRRLPRFGPDDFDLVITDESHHAMAESYLKVYRHFNLPTPDDRTRRGKARHVGLTATPDRGDRQDIMQVFETVAYEYTIQQAIEDGWLVPIHQEMCVLDGLDLSKVRTTAGDLNAADLEELLMPLIEPMARAISEVAGPRRTLIYSPLCTLAELMAEALSRLDPQIATATITAATKNRADLFGAFIASSIPRLSSVGTLTEGVDLPAAEIIAVARPTKVRALYTQIVGRGLRPLPGLVDQYDRADQRRAAIAASSKPRCIVLDFAGNAGRHKLVRCIDLFTDDLDEDTRARAEELAAKGGDPMESLETAIAEAKAMAEAIRSKEMLRVLVDPFLLLDISSAERDPWGRRVTDAQIAAMINCGVIEVDKKLPEADRLSKAREEVKRRFDFRSASAVMSKLGGRIEAGRATLAQVRLLARKGVPLDRAMSMSIGDASTALTSLRATAWKPTTAWLETYART